MDQGRDHSPRASRVETTWPYWVGLIVVLALFQIARTTTVFSQTFDEGIHIACGLEWIERGEYVIEEQHPPLARVVAAIGPYLGGTRLPAGAAWDNVVASANELLHQRGYRRTLMLARLGTLVFFLATCVALALWARRWFGRVGAIIAVAMLATTPSMLAHAGLATTDMGATATIFVAIGALFVWVSRPSWRTAVLAGCCVAVALITKFSSIPFLGLCFVTILLFRWLLGSPVSLRDTTAWRSFGKQALIGGLSCGLVIWAGFRFSIDPLLPEPTRVQEQLTTIAETLSIDAGAVDTVVNAPIFPATALLRGLGQVWQHSQRGHSSYLLGETGRFGWWYFFPVVFTVKTPIPFLILGLASLVLIIRQGIRRRDWRFPALAGCAGVILTFTMTVTINLGIRHILILYPLMALAAGALGPTCVKSKRVAWIVVLLLGWQFVETAVVHPDYLAYFNQFAGEHPEDIRVGSDLDWGQDLHRLSDATRELHIEKLHLAYFGSAALQRHGLPRIERLEPGTPASGWVAISLSRLKKNDPEDYNWLEAYEPHSLVGKSIRLYYIRGDNQ